ncbi:MAG: relaxase/mobilization nuclease domain-containing protein [Eubacterium sp.]|nr:relaxase/mobilization nuclease domain-containing protein [Eubacterium sp.]
MAYTRIHAIKNTVEKAVAYICNPDKTEKKLLVDTFGCGIETARHDFKFALSQTNPADKNQAFHLIQSFAKGEVSHEEAHRIGIELADKLLEGKYSYIVATHTDKGHPHSHILFCAADNIDHKKYYDNKKSYHHIMELSDELCKEHNLSIITPYGRKGKKYVEWKAEQEGLSWKKRLQEDIDECIKLSKSYEDFLRLIKGKGYEVSGEVIGDTHAKYIRFKAPGQKRFIRGSFKNFGAGYTKEDIKSRIDNKEKEKAAAQNPIKPKPRIKLPKKDILTRTGAAKKLIDTNTDKFQKSPGLKHWAAVKNLKTAAASYAEADNISELKKAIDENNNAAKSARTELVELEHQMKKVAELLLYAEQYRDNKSFHEKYKKSKDPDRYLRMHETQLILYDGAARMLQKSGLDPKSVNPDEIRKDYEAMQSRKFDLEKSYKTAEKEANFLKQKLSNIEQYMGKDISIEKSTSREEDLIQ